MERTREQTSRLSDGVQRMAALQDKLQELHLVHSPRGTPLSEQTASCAAVTAKAAARRADLVRAAATVATAAAAAVVGATDGGGDNSHGMVEVSVDDAITLARALQSQGKFAEAAAMLGAAQRRPPEALPGASQPEPRPDLPGQKGAPRRREERVERAPAARGAFERPRCKQR